MEKDVVVVEQTLAKQQHDFVITFFGISFFLLYVRSNKKTSLKCDKYWIQFIVVIQSLSLKIHRQLFVAYLPC